MKLYGSFQNRILDTSKNPKPEIGMGVTESCYTDRHAFEVVAIKDGRHITVRRMKAKCLNYFAGDYELSSDPNGVTRDLFLTKKGQWREKYGRRLGCNVYILGVAREYEDPSF